MGWMLALRRHAVMKMTPDPSQPNPQPGPQPSQGEAGHRYRFRNGKPLDPAEGLHPEMADLEQVPEPSCPIPTSPDALISMQSKNSNERPEKPVRQQSAKVKQVVDLIESLDTSAHEDQQIALMIVRHLERMHDDIVDEMRDDSDAKHSQIVAWAVDADRLMRCRNLLESVDLD